MVALQIRDVPEDVRRVLTAGAAARGQSLQAYLLGVLTAEARRAGNLSLLTARQPGRRDLVVSRAPGGDPRRQTS